MEIPPQEMESILSNVDPSSGKLPDKLEKYRARMYEPTSRSDLEYMLNNKVNIFTYDELKNIRTFEDLMSPYQCSIILYPNAGDPNIGHWCCVFIMPGTDRVEYFDPYGAYIDEPVEAYDRETLHQRRPLEPLLLDLLSNSPFANKVYWNETPFQSEIINVSTCGLWCVLRIKCNYMTEKEFEKLCFDAPNARGLLPDLVCAATISNMYPEMTK